MENFEFGIFHTVEQHVHARKVVGGDVFFLSIDFADTVGAHPISSISHSSFNRATIAGAVSASFSVQILICSR